VLKARDSSMTVDEMALTAECRHDKYLGVI